jgi:hypothetical protein
VCLGVSVTVSPLIFCDLPIVLCVMTWLRVRFATGMEIVCGHDEVRTRVTRAVSHGGTVPKT